MSVMSETLSHFAKGEKHDELRLDALLGENFVSF